MSISVYNHYDHMKHQRLIHPISYIGYSYAGGGQGGAPNKSFKYNRKKP